MQAIDWTRVTAVVGSVTGVIALIVSYFNYRRISTLKSLDLRLELRKAIISLNDSVFQLTALIGRADKSRKAVAANGAFHSGRMVKWATELAADKTELSQLTSGVAKATATFKRLNASELEAMLVEVHKLQGRVNNFREKYESALRSDDQERIQIREDHRASAERKSNRL